MIRNITSSRSLKRLASVAVASTTMVLGLGLAGPIAAHAAPGDFNCAFEGAAAINAPGVQAVGGTGNYHFGGPIVCNTSTTVGPQQGAIASPDGVFANTVCGTGTASDTAGNATATIGSTTYNVTYSITFVAGEGVGTGSVSGSGPYNGDSFRVEASIVPTSGNCATGVLGFTVAGTVHST